MTDKLHSTVLPQIAAGTPYTAVDVFGPTLEFISGPDDPGADFCVMRGVVPPGVAVPLHSHDDAEDFFILSGTQQVLTKSDQGLQWVDVNAGDYVHIPAGTPHAHRNVSDEPAVELVITTARLGRFFQEVARTGVTHPPTPIELAEFVAVATRYGYDLGTPQQNAAVGIALISDRANKVQIRQALPPRTIGALYSTLGSLPSADSVVGRGLDDEPHR